MTLPWTVPPCWGAFLVRCAAPSYFSAFSGLWQTRPSRHDQVHSRHGLNVVPSKLTPCKGCPGSGLDIWPGWFSCIPALLKHIYRSASKFLSFWFILTLHLLLLAKTKRTLQKVDFASSAHRRGFVYMAFFVLATRSHSDHTRRRINRRSSDHCLW